MLRIIGVKLLVKDLVSNNENSIIDELGDGKSKVGRIKF